MKNCSFRKPALFMLVFAVSLILLSPAALAAHSGSSGSISWTMDDSGKLTVTGAGQMTREASRGWLRYADEIKTAEIHDGVTSICEDAFGSCEYLTDISIPASVADIEISEYSGTPFSDSPLLQAVNVSSGNPYFSSEDGVLFDKSKSTLIFHPPAITAASYAIPGSVTKIGPSAFYENENLESVTIPAGLTYIGDGAFCRSGLSGRLTIPNSVTYLGGAAFDSCGLTAVTLPDNMTSIPSGLFYQCMMLTDITIPDSVTSIEDFAFFWCESLDGITIPDGVTRIGEYAFCGCTGFTGITIPDSVTEIGPAAFCNCYGMADPEGFVIVRDVLYGYFGEKTDVTVPRNVTRISQYAFTDNHDYAKVTGVTLPAGVEALEGNAFNDCRSLAAVTILNMNAEFIGNPFVRCANDMILYGWPGSTAGTYAAEYNIAFRPLEPEFFLPASLTAIRSGAFTGISAASVVIPKNVTVIAGNPFDGSGVTIIFGYSGSAAETFAERYGYCFIAVDDAWMARHGR